MSVHPNILRLTEIQCNEVKCKKELNVSLSELKQFNSPNQNPDLVLENISCAINENENDHELNQSRDSREMRENLLNAARQVSEHMSSALSPITSSQRLY